MVNVLGFDIGGANTKAAFMQTQNGQIGKCKVALEYFPVWKEPNKLTNVLLKLRQRLGAEKLDGLGVTMTAELSDAYATKREGVCQILGCVKEAFPNTPIHVLNTNGKLKTLEQACNEPLGTAAANWAATGWLVAQKLRDCVVLDIGSTSASIIPIAEGRVVAKGKTDLEKLMCGELVYTGSLRTNVCSIVHSIPIRGAIATVSSELFSLSGDVHLLLGNITAEQYSSETADGRGKTAAEASARLARVICADTEMLSNQEILNIAQFIYHSQVAQVAQGLKQVYTYLKTLTPLKIPVAITGLGRDFLARKAAEAIGADLVVDLSDLLCEEAVTATPAFAVALMTASKLEGEEIVWIPR